MFMLGAASQRGLLPLSRAAIDRAIELNGVAIEASKQAFEWGRRAAHDLAGVEALVAPDEPAPQPAPTLDALIDRRSAHIRASRGEAEAERYRALVERARRVEKDAGLGEALTAAVDPLLSQADRRQGRMGSRATVRRAGIPGGARREFEGDYEVRFLSAPGRSPRSIRPTGAMKKGETGPWTLTAFRAMARLSFLRGTWLDPFRRSAERQLERRLRGGVRGRRREAPDPAVAGDARDRLRIAGLPESIRGYGRVKEASAAEAAKAREAAFQLLQEQKTPMELAA